MQINTNLSSLDTRRSYERAGEAVSASLQKLSTGQRINSAADDAAGLAISARMEAGVRGMQRAARNISDGISLLQVADGAAGRLADNFQRMRELAVQAANDGNNVLDRASLQQEADALAAANIGIAEGATFNGRALLDGTFSAQLQVGAQAGQTINLNLQAALVPRGYNTGLVDVSQHQVTVQGEQVKGALLAGALTIRNGAVGASVAGAKPGQGADSAYAVAAAINAANLRDVAATASTTWEVQVGAAGALPNAGIAINGVAIGAIAGGSAAARAASAAAAISAALADTGVSASADGGTLTLSAVDGRNIEVAEAGAGYAGSLGLAVGAYRGSVTVTETRLGAHTLAIGGRSPESVGLSGGRQSSQPTGARELVLKDIYSAGEPPIELSTHGGASDAIDYLDGKLDTISQIRAQLGAAQNRMEAAQSQADLGADQLSAARSRIRDTDYASEAAQLTRGQILQQAGAAMVAQANAQPQYALILLR